MNKMEPLVISKALFFYDIIIQKVMSGSDGMEQNIIAVVWDFDKTLIDGYMQIPIFKKYQIEEKNFWQEVGEIGEKYEKMGIRVNKDTLYLNHMITCVKQGIFKGLNNALLFELGNELKFYKGIPEIFLEMKQRIEKDEKFSDFNIKVEHYIVSTGFAEMIKGSPVAKYVEGIWGCEFIEKPIASKLKGNETENEKKEIKEISQISYSVDNTTKTRAIYEINKGVNWYGDIDVNSKINNKDRRVPFENIIYIADGPSDVPVFSVLKSNGGQTFAIYPKGDVKAFKQVDQLRKDGRIDMFGEADYSKGTITNMWLLNHVEEIAKKIYFEKVDQIKNTVSEAPKHINE
jgi:hypothetical protein